MKPKSGLKKGEAYYRCKACGSLVIRQSDKAWLVSECTQSGNKKVRICRVPDAREVEP